MKQFFTKIKQMPPLKKMLFMFIAIMVATAGIIACMIGIYISQITYVDASTFKDIDDEFLNREMDIGELNEEPFTVIGKDDSESEPEDPFEKYEAPEGITNILLIGVDRQGTSGYGRSDCIMIASINAEDNTIRLASILRDNYVEIPGHGKNKINAAYAFGGPELLLNTIRNNFGMSIEKYMFIDFEQFSKIVDILGGVDITLSEKEAEKVFFKKKESKKYHLDGKQALRYVRIRKIDSDFQRTERQRKLMMSAFKDLQKKEKLELLPICKQILPYLNTNIKKSEILGLLKTATELKNIKLKQHVVPAEKTFKFAKTSSGASIISLDFSENSRLLYNFVYN